MRARSLALLSGLRIRFAMSCGVGHRHSADLALLWLWHRQAATAPFRPLAGELPYATGVAEKEGRREGRKKEGEKGRKEKKKNFRISR